MVIRDVEALEALRGRARRLLAVLPHPDDESYGPAGALARAGGDPDAASVLFCMTRGTASSIGPRNGLDPDTVGDLRERRLVEVARLLRLDGLIVGDFPDGGLVRAPLDETAGAIARVLDALRPQVVIGHDARGVNAHPDHVAVHWALRHALLGRSIRFAMVAYGQDVVDAVAPRLMFATPDEEVDAELHLTDEERAAKEAALRVHEALVTMDPDADDGRIVRPPVERFDFLGEQFREPRRDLFADLPAG